jgi:hypothetical protein
VSFSENASGQKIDNSSIVFDDDMMEEFVKWVKSVVDQLVESNGPLRDCTLDFSGNKLTDKGLKTFANFLRDSALHCGSINLSNNAKITDLGFAEIVAYLQCLKIPVKSLDLSGNGLSNKAVMLLGTSLSKHNDYPRFDEGTLNYVAFELRCSGNKYIAEGSTLLRDLERSEIKYCLTKDESHNLHHNCPILFLPDISEEYKNPEGIMPPTLFTKENKPKRPFDLLRCA